MEKNRFAIIISSIALAIGVILMFALYNVIQMPNALLVINSSNILLFAFALLYNQKRE